MNCSYYVNLVTNIPLLFLRLIYHVLIPPAHHPDRPWHPLRLLSQCIDILSVNPLRYGRLPPLDVYSDMVEPRGVYRFLYHYITPLSAVPMFCRNLGDQLCHPMVERCKKLENLPDYHLTLASID